MKEGIGKMKTIRSMFEQLYWADGRILDSLQTAGDGNAEPEAVRLLSHILRSEQVWLTRLQDLDSNHLPLWPYRRTRT
ncbi:putative damage-inducible protein DinB [Paenibacillus rhizosphaerae]|uniref:Putative damage-inducible protein DinB n=1 Tax=Paenibacillus rhizosphaerae TaxID=297318 RepID=A0A839TTM6_9BACL|nr:hypothetical protein [Paenibacillus rhizosphaerae]MBB3128639.1 putative damage-inducible protein DinB [Paenibacillus rhizosphaerae]